MKQLLKGGKLIHDGNPNPPVDTISSTEQSCPSWLSWSCCRYGSYFAVASLVLEPADCQADMHELAYRVMCMPWVKRTEHVGVWSEWFLMTFVQGPPKKRDKVIRIWARTAVINDEINVVMNIILQFTFGLFPPLFSIPYCCCCCCCCCCFCCCFFWLLWVVLVLVLLWLLVWLLLLLFVVVVVVGVGVGVGVGVVVGVVVVVDVVVVVVVVVGVVVGVVVVVAVAVAVAGGGGGGGCCYRWVLLCPTNLGVAKTGVNA